ncbi:cytochrome P450 [Chiua virens]|nr:cytochrome P450 [Chiua virens]
MNTLQQCKAVLEHAFSDCFASLIEVPSLVMDFQLPLPNFATISTGVAYGVAGFVAAVIFIAKLSHSPNLDSFPSVGSSSWLGSWWAGFKYLTHAQTFIQEGYDKHGSAPFKIPGLLCWTVVVSHRGHLEELAKASDDQLSIEEVINDQLHIEEMLGSELRTNPYHIPIIRSQLTRNIDALYNDIRNEIVTSFEEVLDLKGHEWMSLSALGIVEKVVCRTSNRVFVNLPLCRNPDWIDLNLRCTFDVMTGGVIIGLFPRFIRPLASRFLTNVPQCIARGARLLRPIIEERQRYLSEYGIDWDDKPNDLLSWLMEEAKGSDLTVEQLTIRILGINIAAIHTSSNSFTQALFYLAANPQYVQPLREEVERIVEKDGWTKAALVKMRKVDSFLKECLRIEGINTASISRKAMKDFKFSDGTFIPKGTLIAAATGSVHHDGNLYDNPGSFEPFRFANMGKTDGKIEGFKHHFASTSTEYLPFGLGRHACPGRFFAANELKSMLAHVIVTYDLKLEDEAFPQNLHIATAIGANQRAKVMFRNRQR